MWLVCCPRFEASWNIGQHRHFRQPRVESGSRLLSFQSGTELRRPNWCGSSEADLLLVRCEKYSGQRCPKWHFESSRRWTESPKRFVRHYAGLLSAHDVEKEMRQSGVDALVEAGAIADSRTPHLVAAAKQSAAALAEVERTVVNGSSGRVQSAGAYRRPTTPTPRSGTASDNNLYVSGPQRAVRLPARTVSPQGRGSVQNPAESPTRPVIIGGGGRRPASLGSLPAPTRLSAARLQVEEPSPTGTADLQGEQEHVDLHRQTLNQILEPFLDQASAPGTDQRALQALQRFLKVVPDPLRRWTGPGSPLVMVSRAGRADVARMLLRANANANDSDAKGVTALHIAVFDGNAELCKVLLNSRADVAAADRHGQTPLFFARVTSNGGLVKQSPQSALDAGILIHCRRGMASSKQPLPKSKADSSAMKVSASFPDLSAFPDLSWTKKRSPKLIQEPPRRFGGPKHVQGYSGHIPRKFNPFAGKHILKSASLPQIKSGATGSASQGSGMWYGHVGNFPSPVDNWAPAHFVDGLPPP
eukprot:symbB.v1.2.000109.t1/scaffold13.1/size649204/20